MIRPIKVRTTVITFILAAFSIGYAVAQNKVVVIPLSGNDSSTCPSDTSRIGTFCIDNTLSSAASAGAAINDCISKGRMVCPVKAYVMCDVQSVGFGSACQSDTDTNTSLLSSDHDFTDSANAFDRFIIYTNNLMGLANNTATTRDYYCCGLVTP